MPQIEIPGVGVVEFPDTLSPAQLTAAAKEAYDGAALGGSLKRQGFTQPPPSQEFLGGMPSTRTPRLIGAIATSPLAQGALLALPGVGSGLTTAGRVGWAGLKGAAMKAPIVGPMGRGALQGMRHAWATPAARAGSAGPKAVNLSRLIKSPSEFAAEDFAIARDLRVARPAAQVQGMRNAGRPYAR